MFFEEPKNKCLTLYRYGFNGQEKDDEVNGVTGSSYTAEFWQYDSRLGRRWNIDPKPNPEISGYAAFAGNPIWYSDSKGDTIAINLFSSSDEPIFNKTAKAGVSNPMNDGVFIVYAHSNNKGIQYVDKYGGIQLATSAEDVNKLLSERSPEWQKAMKDGKKMVLVLNSCNASSKEYISHSDGKPRKVEQTIAEKFLKRTLI